MSVNKVKIEISKTPEEQLVADITLLFRKYDRAVMSERVKRGIQARKERLANENK